MDMACDMAVIGAGPAGTTAARLLAAGGRRVLLLERERLPRHKACGGGLPPRTLAALGLSVPTELLYPVTSVALDGAYNGRQSYPLTGGTFVVERARFDEFLARQAVAAGAELWDSCRVARRGADHEGRVRLLTKRGMVFARQVIVAAGATSVLPVDMDLGHNAVGFCVEATVPMPDGLDEAVRHRAVFNLALLRCGYGWSFPRGKRFAVGVGSAHYHFRQARQVLERFCRRTPELARQPLENVRGAMIPEFAGPRRCYARDRVFLAGDAAGLVDPLTGEGIYYAVCSGRLAAEAILSGGGEAEYEQRLRVDLLPDLRHGARLARLFRLAPAWLRGGGMMLPGFRRCACRFVEILEGQRAYRTLF